MWLINIVKYVRLVYENLNIVKNIIATIENRDTTNHQSSNTLTRFLLQLSEQERKRLASDLHDSALQDRNNLVSEIRSTYTKFKYFTEGRLRDIK